MAIADPYGRCPCGSGEKYKFCCQKVEVYAERAHRAIENGQLDLALKSLDEGLRTDPQNPWLGLRRALILAQKEDMKGAIGALATVLSKRPKHALARSLLVRLTLQSEGALVAAGRLQEALSAVDAENRPLLAQAAELLGVTMADTGMVTAGLAHLELAEALAADEQTAVSETLRMVESNPASSPWLRNPYSLSPPPAELDVVPKARFEQAVGWAAEGLWSPAAAAFDSLSAEQTPESDRNLGLCRLWLGDYKGAVEALRRYTSWIGPRTDTVDLEALCQLIAQPTAGERVNLLQWIWSLRDRERLLETLRSDPRLQQDEPEPLDPSDPASPTLEVFLILDRPKPAVDAVRGVGDVARVQGRLLVGNEIVMLEAFDDGRLDRLADWFRETAGVSIPPAHPRTKNIGHSTRVSLALRTEWVLPEGTPEADAKRLLEEERRRVLLEVWPATPLPVLAGKTPRQAAPEPRFELPLRAALCVLSSMNGVTDISADLASLRADLDIAPEPDFDEATVDVENVHLGRLHQLRPEKLPDDQLLLMYARAHRYVLPRALESSARELIRRPGSFEREGALPRPVVYGDMANLELITGGREAALRWIEEGRNAEPASERTQNAIAWDLTELRLRSRTEPPEQWVPHLASMLDRYRSGDQMHPALLSTLVQLGLVQLVPSPDRPGDVYMDSRPLQAVLARYGPRITTAGGQLGVTAAKGGIWTPESEKAGGGGGVWTPGSDKPPAAGGDKPRLIIPGR